MKPTNKYDIKESLVQVVHNDGEVIVKRGVWLEGEGLCAIYDLDENWFPFVCTISGDLGYMLASRCEKVE